VTGRVLVLGDSCTLDAGPGLSLPSRLGSRLGPTWALMNHSAPGATSRTIRNHIHRIGDKSSWDFIVLYIGNVDGYGRRVGRTAVSTVESHALGWFSRRRHSRRRHGPSGTRPVSRTDPVNAMIEFVPKPIFQPAVDISEFRDNIREILNWSDNFSQRTAVIIPRANDIYPAGMMHPNAAFARLYGLAPVPTNWMNATDVLGKRLIAAARAWEIGYLSEAEASYKELMQTEDDWTGLSANNLGVLYLENDALELGVCGLQNLANDENSSFSATAAYNLTRLQLLRRDADFEASVRALVDKDAYLYRISGRQRNVLFDECSRYDSITAIDLADLLKDSSFIDYCHPTPGQIDVIADAVIEKCQIGLNRQDREDGYAVIERYIPALGTRIPGGGFLDELGCANVAEAERTVWANLGTHRSQRRHDNSQIASTSDGTAFSVALAWCRRHPLYRSDADLSVLSEYFIHGCFRFPELIFDNLYRMSLQFLPNIPKTCEIYDSIAYWNYSESNFMGRIKIFDSNAAQMKPRVYLQSSIKEVVHATINRLHQWKHLFAPQLGPRLLATRYWYLREAFRFGSWSRLTMLYPYWELEYLAHSLIYATIVDSPEQRSDVKGVISELLVLLRDINDAHAELTAKAVDDSYVLGPKAASPLAYLAERIPSNNG
jgi:hypothetical protein